MSHIPRAIGVISSLISQFRILVAHPSGEKSGRWLSRAVKALRGLAFVTMQAILLTLITTSSQAQTIPPTTCSPTNYFQAPLGWQPSAPYRMCSEIYFWQFETHQAWVGAPLPNAPVGNATFFPTVGAISGVGSDSLSTVMTGLVPGRLYRIPFYGLPRGLASHPNEYQACTGLRITTTGQTRALLYTSSGWTVQFFEFIALSASQPLTVEAIST